MELFQFQWQEMIIKIQMQLKIAAFKDKSLD